MILHRQATLHIVHSLTAEIERRGPYLRIVMGTTCITDQNYGSAMVREMLIPKV